MSRTATLRNAVLIREALARLGLSHAAPSVMIAAGLDEAGVELTGPPIANAVAQAIEPDNAEILRD